MIIDPQEGQRWRYRFAPDQSDDYWITFVSDEWVHLTDFRTGQEEAPYPREIFDAARSKGDWEYVTFSEDTCPKCRQNAKAEGDYLCDECRYG